MQSSTRCVARPKSIAIASLRVAAELDNFRKRSAREVDAARKFGAERLAQAILPVRDSLEAGSAAAEKAGQSALLDGLRATLRLLDEAFSANGIREINPAGETLRSEQARGAEPPAGTWGGAQYGDRGRAKGL